MAQSQPNESGYSSFSYDELDFVKKLQLWSKNSGRPAHEAIQYKHVTNGKEKEICIVVANGEIDRQLHRLKQGAEIRVHYVTAEEEGIVILFDVRKQDLDLLTFKPRYAIWVKRGWSLCYNMIIGNDPRSKTHFKVLMLPSHVCDEFKLPFIHKRFTEEAKSNAAFPDSCAKSYDEFKADLEAHLNVPDLPHFLKAMTSCERAGRYAMEFPGTQVQSSLVWFLETGWMCDIGGSESDFNAKEKVVVTKDGVAVFFPAQKSPAFPEFAFPVMKDLKLYYARKDYQVLLLDGASLKVMYGLTMNDFVAKLPDQLKSTTMPDLARQSKLKSRSTKNAIPTPPKELEKWISTRVEGEKEKGSESYYPVIAPPGGPDVEQNVSLVYKKGKGEDEPHWWYDIGSNSKKDAEQATFSSGGIVLFYKLIKKDGKSFTGAEPTFAVRIFDGWGILYEKTEYKFAKLSTLLLKERYAIESEEDWENVRVKGLPNVLKQPVSLLAKVIRTFVPKRVCETQEE